MITSLYRHPLRFILRMSVAATVCIGAACDADPADEPSSQALPCNLADEACAALASAADAVALLEQMGIDPDEADVELVEAPSRPEAVDALKAENRPQDQPQSCNSNGIYECCCWWGGPLWGCECRDAPNP